MTVSLIHTRYSSLVFSACCVFTSRCLEAASNGRRSPSSGLLNGPGLSYQLLTATAHNDWTAAVHSLTYQLIRSHQLADGLNWTEVEVNLPSTFSRQSVLVSGSHQRTQLTAGPVCNIPARTSKKTMLLCCSTTLTDETYLLYLVTTAV
jgi:hypothetical protein